MSGDVRIKMRAAATAYSPLDRACCWAGRGKVPTFEMAVGTQKPRWRVEEVNAPHPHEQESPYTPQ